MPVNDRGHTKSSGHKVYPIETDLKRYYGVLKVRIDEVIYTDDKRNNSFDVYGFKAVQYTCRIIGGEFNGNHLFNVIDLPSIGGINNYDETIRTPVEEEPLRNNSGDVEAKLSNGDFALIIPINGDLRYPIIFKGFYHPKNKKIGAKKDQGKRKLWEFNGIEFNVDKNGNARLRNVGFKNAKGAVVSSDGVGAEFILHKNGDAEFNAYGTADETIPDATASKDLKIILTKKEKKAEVFAQENSLTMDSSGIIIQDKNGNKIIMGANGISLEDSNGNKLKLEGAGINLNSSTQNVKIDGSIYNDHRHVGNLGVPTDMPLDRNTE